MAGYGGVPFFDGAEGENFSASGPPFVSTTVERVHTSQHGIMSSAMLGAKRARMKVEADRQVLVNRISRLQSEEMKAVKRIEETHCRTQEVLAVKNRQQRAELDKRAARVQQETELELHREALAEAKSQQRYAVMAARQAAAIARQSEAHGNRQQAAHRALAIAQVRGEEYNQAVFKRSVVRQMEVEARDRRLREKQLMIQQMALNADAKRRHEEETIMHRHHCHPRTLRLPLPLTLTPLSLPLSRSLSLSSEDKLSDLEREELALIESLQRCQEEQRDAYRSIDEALMAGGKKLSQACRGIERERERASARARERRDGSMDRWIER